MKMKELFVQLPSLQFFATNTTGTINSGSGATSTKPNAYYDKLLLKLLVQTDFHHAKFAQNRPMPKRTGDTINFRKITKLGVSTTPLTEAVTPAGQSAALTAISATTAQYGNFLEFSDLVDVTMVDPIVKEYTVEMGRSARETLDILTREELNGGSNVRYASGRTSTATLAAGDKPTVDDFRKAVLAMKKAHVKPCTDGKYIAFISPDVSFDLLDDPKFLKAHEIGQNNKPLIKGEVADVYGIKFIEVVNAKVKEGAGASGVNVHCSVILGEKPYGITKIEGNGDIQTIIKSLGSAGTADPLNQRQSIGWKVNAFVAKRLEEAGICRYESVPTNA